MRAKVSLPVQPAPSGVIFVSRDQRLKNEPLPGAKPPAHDQYEPIITYGRPGRQLRWRASRSRMAALAA
jgi:hypothetical protein